MDRPPQQRLSPNQLDRMFRLLSRREESLLRALGPRKGAPAQEEWLGALSSEFLPAALEEVRAARDRLAKGTYGTCVECAAPIARERLEKEPHAARCDSCVALRVRST